MNRWGRQFKKLLEETRYVTPGKRLSEVRVFFLGRECFEALSEREQNAIYHQHQKDLHHAAKLNFQVGYSFFYSGSSRSCRRRRNWNVEVPWIHWLMKTVEINCNNFFTVVYFPDSFWNLFLVSGTFIGACRPILSPEESLSIRHHHTGRHQRDQRGHTGRF